MTDTHLSTENSNDLSIVYFGASAGGLETYLEILSLLPAETGLVFIVIHHQPSDWKSLLPGNYSKLYRLCRLSSWKTERLRK